MSKLYTMNQNKNQDFGIENVKEKPEYNYLISGKIKDDIMRIFKEDSNNLSLSVHRSTENTQILVKYTKCNKIIAIMCNDVKNTFIYDKNCLTKLVIIDLVIQYLLSFMNYIIRDVINTILYLQHLNFQRKNIINMKQ